MLHAPDGLPQFFRQCFEEHCRLLQSSRWGKMPLFYASIEDPPYMEQKYATLMAAVELFIRNSLIEGGQLQAAEAESKTLPKLIGMARAKGVGKLQWDLPQHYTQAERYRETRNAVAHGGSFPQAASETRWDFDKWMLFLRRRLFMRLGFDGHIASPSGGWRSASPVHDFSEEHNSFGK
jgi:hypothetical protein